MCRREEDIYRLIENFKKSCKEGKKSGRNKDPWKKENETNGKIEVNETDKVEIVCIQGNKRKMWTGKERKIR